MRSRTSHIAFATSLVVGLATLALPGRASLPLAAPDGSTVEFTASGDFSSSSEASAVLGQISATNPDFHLALGDLSYGATGAEDAWCDFVTDRVGAGFPFELIAGNHESNGLNGNINDFSACLPNQLPGLVGTYGRQWYVDVPQAAPLVRVVAISPAVPFPSGDWSYSPGSARYAWTASAIDGARADGIPWVVAAMHKPCLSVGTYGCDVGAGITNLLVEKKVDLVLYGHEHSYMRTHQISHGPGCTSLVPGSYDPDCVSDSAGDLERGAGTVFATVGTGGIALRSVDGSDSEAPYFAAISGSNVEPTWGNLRVNLTADTLSAQFERAVGDTFTDDFTIATPDPGANVAPTASFTASTSGLQTDVDGSGSSDPEGPIASYAWTFGDGGTASGPTASHTYASAGTYTIGLTVTDNAGATGTVTDSVTVTDPGGATPIAQDLFERSVASGWGSADVGGAWSGTSGSATSVSGGTGRLTMAAGRGLDAYLTGVASTATSSHATLTLDRAATGSGLYAFLHGRRVNSASYRAKIRVYETGVANLYLTHNATGGETYLAALRLPGVTIGSGDALEVRLEVEGTSPTVLRARAWPAGTAEPSTWQVSATDNAASLQTAGHVGISTYLSSGATNVPLTVLVDDYSVTAVE